MNNRILPAGIAGALVLLTVVALSPPANAADDPVAIATKAFELRMEGRVDDAVQMLEDGIAEHPDAGILHYELARARLFLLEIDKMHAEAEAAVRCAPGDNDFRYFAAMASGYALIDAAHHGDEERMKTFGQESLDQLETILAADPDNHQARYLLVQLSVDMAPDLGLKAGDMEAHVLLLEEKDPILGAKARCCLVDEKEQHKLWDQVLADHPDDCRALVEAADGLITAGDLDLAEKCLDKAIAKDKSSCYGLLRLGLAYFMKQDWDRAIALTQRYLDADPPLALAAYATGRMGMIHHRKGDRDRGREFMDEARKIDPHVWQTVMPPPKEIFTTL
ncbi:MAG: tetratricopeptide repeat protein [Krumholzibacteria bacterium]|nr:tetratricopeptide repeat protein [Candidatus Krumholzibacteria bacterium]